MNYDREYIEKTIRLPHRLLAATGKRGRVTLLLWMRRIALWDRKVFTTNF